MTPKQLIRVNPPEIRRRSADVHIVKATRSRMRKSGKLRLSAIVSSRSRPGKKHRVVIESIDKKFDALSAGGVRVWCDCEFFTWNGCADVLPTFNAGFPKKATGYMPDIKNPRRLPFQCIHVHRVLSALIKVGK